MFPGFETKQAKNFTFDTKVRVVKNSSDICGIRPGSTWRAPSTAKAVFSISRYERIGPLPRLNPSFSGIHTYKSRKSEYFFQLSCSPTQIAKCITLNVRFSSFRVTSRATRSFHFPFGEKCLCSQPFEWTAAALNLT